MLTVRVSVTSMVDDKPSKKRISYLHDRPLAQELSLVSKKILKLAEREYFRISGLNGFEAIIVYRLGVVGPTWARSLLEKVSMHESQASTAIQSLVANNLVTRIPDQVDSRRKLLMLTKKGAEAYKKVNDLFVKRQAKLLSGVDNDELAQFFDTLEKIGRNAENLLNEDLRIENGR